MPMLVAELTIRGRLRLMLHVLFSIYRRPRLAIKLITLWTAALTLGYLFGDFANLVAVFGALPVSVNLVVNEMESVLQSQSQRAVDGQMYR
jgi:hypothetical protein